MMMPGDKGTHEPLSGMDSDTKGGMCPVQKDSRYPSQSMSDRQFLRMLLLHLAKRSFPRYSVHW